MTSESKKQTRIFQSEYTTVPTLLNDLVGVQRGADYTFRGISRRIENRPKIQRVRQRESSNTIDCSKHEYEILYDFHKMGRPYFSVNYETLDYVACAQHYGVPTRLVDWTRNPFVALFFAVFNNPNPDDGEYRIYYAKLSEHMVIDRIYGLDTQSSSSCESEFIFMYKAFIEAISDKTKLREILVSRNSQIERIGIKENYKFGEDGLIFFNPPMSNDRLIAQQGLFSVPCSIQGNDAEIEIDEKADYFTIKLDAVKRIELLKYLTNMNYVPTRLFPELESIGNFLSRKYSEQQDSVISDNGD